MSTISNNTNEALVKKFVKHPRQFESYYKHCINILKEYVWMNENQYNEEITNYEYLTKLMNYHGLSQFILSDQFNNYENIIIDAFPKQTIITIHTNIYFPDKLDVFMTNLSIDHSKLPDKNIKYKIKRVDFNIFTNRKIDQNKEYTIDEIFSLVHNNDIFVINGYLSDYELKNNESFENKIFMNRKCCQILELDNISAELFYSLDNKNKELWTIIFEPFCQYLRIYALNFNKQDNDCIDMYHDFYDAYNHIKELIELLLKYYNKKRKEPPYIIKNTLQNHLQLIEKYKIDYEMINLSKIIKNRAQIDKNNIKILIK